jgi:diguanylate cyclase (GGDEF)-like protein
LEGTTDVIGEICKPGIDSYLNHCFPGTDIPSNAESLYLKKRQRFIANAEQDPVPLLSNSDHPLDLTGAELRQVHPVHRQYMRNMGTASSFSVSIVVNKALWGMVVCHNYQSAALSFQARQMCMHKANIAGLHMQSLLLRCATLRRHRQENLLRQLRQELFSQPFNPASARVGLHFLLRIFRASGAFLVHNHTWYRLGKMPDSVVCFKLRCWLSENQVQPLFSTDTVIPELADQANFTRLASGVLSLNYSDDNYLVILRREYRQNRRWAGPPQHSQQQMSSLGPRASFSTWFEQTHGKAVPWSEIDLEAAHDLLRLLAEVTQYRKAERRSLTDPLTGLGNREFMHNQLNAWLESSPAAVARFAVVLLDLDEFKPINDRYGHSVGDQVLVQVAHRLQGCVRGSDHVIRLGGDEFVMLLGGFDDRSNLSELAQRVIQQLQQPYRVNGLSLNVVASMGIALFPDHGRDVAELLKKADEAMYQVKRAGRGTSMLYGDTFL